MKKESRRIGRRRIINQDILKISVFFAVLFFGLIAFLGIFLVFRADSVINNDYNKRSGDLKMTVSRGSIYAAGGEVLAYSDTGASGGEERIYPYGRVFAHVVGFEGRGGLGLESSYDISLLTSDVDVITKIGNEFAGRKSGGNSIVTTLDASLQQAMYDILGENEGAIIAIDPVTGQIKGMVSYPSFDPGSIDENWDELTAEGSSVLLNRATQGTYTPGSTFKIFTLLEYYRQKGGNISDYAYTCTGSYSKSGSTISCVNGIKHGAEDIFTSFANSCNCSFANMAFQMDMDRFAADNEKLLFNTDLGLDIASRKSSFTLSSASSDFMIMQTCFGQGETLISPAHLAMITCAIANDGVLMKPYLVSSVINSNADTVSRTHSTAYGRLLTTEEAAFMKECMRMVVTQGTGVVLSYEGNYTAYGKTGTAETLNDSDESHDHSWFTGFAENNGQKLVVCAMISDMQSSGMTGLGAVKQVFDYYFGK
mgnify:FL=1